MIRRIKKTWSTTVASIEFVNPDVVGVLHRKGCCVLDPKHEIRVGYDAQDVVRYLVADCEDADLSESVSRLGGGRTCGAVLGLVRARLVARGDGAKAIDELRRVDGLLGDLFNNHAGPAADAGRSTKGAEPEYNPSVWLAKVACRVSRVELGANWKARTIVRGEEVFIRCKEGRWLVAESVNTKHRGMRPIRDCAPRVGNMGPCAICGGGKNYQVMATHCNSLPHKQKFVDRLRAVAAWLNERALVSSRLLVRRDV